MTSIVLAEYFTTRDNTLLFIGRNDFKEPLIKEIPMAIDEILTFASDTFGTTKDRKTKIHNLDSNAWQKRFGIFVEPLLPYTKEGDTIWFVPHDALHYLPLHALQIEGRPLIERNPICYTPSASIMKFCHAKRKGKHTTALVLGDSRSDLTYASEEAMAIASLFDTKPFLRDQATKSLLLAQLAQEREQPNVLHISCHGYFQFEHPLQSGIMLAPEPSTLAGTLEGTHSDDAQWNLTTEEIFGLSMHTELVTLSACETGVNEHKPGDELIGLTRSLIYAGTPSVIVSLWPVDDLSTSLLMQHFYQQWGIQSKDGRDITKAEALRLAQLHVKNLTGEEVEIYASQRSSSLTNRNFTSGKSRQLRRPKGGPQNRPFENMYYWAPFVLIGDWQ